MRGPTQGERGRQAARAEIEEFDKRHEEQRERREALAREQQEQNRRAFNRKAEIQAEMQRVREGRKKPPRS